MSMDTNRYIVEKIDRIAEDTAATRARMDLMHEYIDSVAKDQKDIQKKLEDHRESVEAHGVIAGRRTSDVYMKWFTLATAFAGLLLGFKKGEH